MSKPTKQITRDIKRSRSAAVLTPTDLTADATRDIAAALNGVLADVFALYIKTKNFHWHMSGPHFRDYHLRLDEQATQLYAMTDPIEERVRKVGGSTLKSIGEIARKKRVLDNDADYVEPLDMLAELREDGTIRRTKKSPRLGAEGFGQFAKQILSADRYAGLQIRWTNNRQRRLGHDQFDPEGIPSPEIRRRVRLAQCVHAWLFRSGGCFGETRQLKHDP